MLFHQVKNLNHCAFPVKHPQSTVSRWFSAAAVLVCLLLVNCKMPEKSSDNSSPTTSPALANSKAPGSRDPAAIHQNAIVIDLHADTTQRVLDEGVDLAQRLSGSHGDPV